MALIPVQAETKKKDQLRSALEKRESKKLSLSDFIIPIGSLVVLTILCFAVFIPMVRSALESIEEIKKIDKKIAQLNELNKQIDQIDENKLNDDVLTSRAVIPTTLLVSDLVFYVDNLAKSLNLQISKLSSADSLNSVSGPIGYEGEYSSVIDFLDKAQNVSPYMIRLESIKLSRKNKNDGTDTWTLDMTISGYYLSDATREKPSIYDKFVPYTKYSDTILIFEEKKKKQM